MSALQTPRRRPRPKSRPPSESTTNYSAPISHPTNLASGRSPNRSANSPVKRRKPVPAYYPEPRQEERRARVAHSVATGSVGRAFGPYSYEVPQSREESVLSESEHDYGAQNTATTTVPQYIWDKEADADDIFHDPDPLRDVETVDPFSLRGWMNVAGLGAILLALLFLFMGYPIILAVEHPSPSKNGFNIGGINGSGQIPELPGLPRLIDQDTPASAMTRTGTDGKKYNLVFSDEFNTDGRTFYPGDDPFFEAVDLWYWPTSDIEWYDPSVSFLVFLDIALSESLFQAVTTKDGSLQITITEKLNHGLDFMSGMVTSWNKLCFTTGYVEVSISLPGSTNAPGLWPGAWTLGNLGRAGYGATTQGTWPYTYDSCDLGTYPNQTNPDGSPPAAATGGLGGTQLSGLPGQRLSSCTCPGSDHPGPTTSTGRGVPEVDILEARIDLSSIPFRGEVSQSYQVAPYNYQYKFDESKSTIYDSSATSYNAYQGGPLQQSVSALTFVDSNNYNKKGFGTYGFELWSDPDKRDDGYITWISGGKKSWTLPAAAIGADPTSQVGPRLISEEPMYLIFNLGMSPSFQPQDYKHLVFPSTMYVDYVRIYQRDTVKLHDGLNCSPSKRPTADYINNHLNAYTNPNWTTWDQAGYFFPRNSVYDGC
ncbi:glycoside hydrolase family 16 protein [Mycena floridula]|nr:glycoside hydrolase family 16 protein [Mycena floridula]